MLPAQLESYLKHKKTEAKLALLRSFCNLQPDDTRLLVQGWPYLNYMVDFAGNLHKIQYFEGKIALENTTTGEIRTASMLSELVLFYSERDFIAYCEGLRVLRNLGNEQKR